MRSTLPILVLILCTSAALAQPLLPGDEVLATVNGRAITRTELEQRLTLSIFPYKDQRRLADLIPRQFLLSLIAERLLADEARARGIDREEPFHRSLDLAEEMFVRDRLYRDEIRAKIRITEADLRRRFTERRAEQEYQFLYSESEQEIRSLAALVREGIPFDTLLEVRRSTGDPDAAPRTDAVDRELARAMRRLAPGSVGEPLRAGEGWYLLRRMDLRPGLASEEDFLRRRRSLESELRREREAEATVAFMRTLWRARTATFSETPLRIAGDRIWRNLRMQARRDSIDHLTPDAALYDSLRDDARLRLHEAFVRVDADSLSVRDMIDRIELRAMRVRRDELRRFPARLEQLLREITDWWMLGREGYRRGLDQHPDVRRDMEGWIESGLAQGAIELAWEQFAAHDDSLWSLVEALPSLVRGLPEVRIDELVATDSLRAAEASLLIAAGVPPDSLARAWSTHPRNVARPGVRDWFSVATHAPVGRMCFDMQIGAMGGPVRTAEGWSVFRLRDRRWTADVPPLRSMRELREMSGEELRAGFTARRGAETVTRLARAAEIRIDEAALGRVRTPTMQMFTVRHLGFGGRIPAAPAVMPLFEAVMEGMSTRQQLQP
jgi:peptidyl-prolyl cis-trans isomerase C